MDVYEAILAVRESEMRDPPRSKQKQGLTQFGRWVEALNTLLGTNQAEMCRGTGISKQTLSEATRGKNALSRDVFLKLVEAYRAVSFERQIILPPGWEFYFSYAWLGTTVQGDILALEYVEQAAATIKERNQLRTDVSMMRRGRTIEGVQSLMAEMEQLRKENEQLKAGRMVDPES